MPWISRKQYLKWFYMEQNIDWHNRCREKERQRKIGLCEYFEKTNSELRKELKKIKHENRLLRGQIKKSNFLT